MKCVHLHQGLLVILRLHKLIVIAFVVVRYFHKNSMIPGPNTHFLDPLKRIVQVRASLLYYVFYQLVCLTSISPYKPLYVFASLVMSVQVHAR